MPIIASASIKAVSMTLVSLAAVKWDTYDVENTAGNPIQDDVIRTASIQHGNRAEVFIWQNFQPAYRAYRFD